MGDAKWKSQPRTMRDAYLQNLRYSSLAAGILSLAWPIMSAIKLFCPNAIAWKEALWVPLMFLAIPALILAVNELTYRTWRWLNRHDLSLYQPKSDKIST
jgi:hypothetical protein